MELAAHNLDVRRFPLGGSARPVLVIPAKAGSALFST